MIVRLLLAALLGAAACCAAVAQEPGGAASARGIELFRARDYAGALQSFLEAQRAGADAPGLRYNLGVTYYRLGRYPEAEGEFTGLTQDPAWAPLARYNLGLTAQRMGRQAQARAHFERAREADEPRLRSLAAVAIARLDASTAPTSVLLSAAAGYDSNATLSPDASTVALQAEGDAFLETFAAASHRLSGTAATQTHLHGGLYARRYADLEPYDLAALRLGMSRDTAGSASQWGFGGYFDHVEASNGRLQQAAMLDAHVRRSPDSERDLRGRYQFAAIDGGGDFAYLDGWQQRFSVEAGLPIARARLNLGYELELNDRDDLRLGADFFSYSPTRHSLLVQVIVPASGGWRLEARGELRASRYNDPHRLDAGTTILTRHDDRWGAGMRASRAFGSGRRLFFDYGYYRNESNIDAYDYDRHQALAGVELTF